MRNRLFGGILLIVGTSIGGGMLGLPVANAEGGFLCSMMMMLGAWALMTFCALLMLEVNLHLPEHSNIISMANQTLGKPGKIAAWLAYLLLLYTLISLYVAGSSSVIQNLAAMADVTLPVWLAASALTLVLGTIIFKGIRLVDIINRGLILAKVLLFIGLLTLTLRHVDVRLLQPHHWTMSVSGLTVMITSFGFASIVPSLRYYLKSDVKQLRLAIIMGSSIPLVAYSLWLLVIIGTIPLEGEYGLIQIKASGHVTTLLSQAFQQLLHNNLVTVFSGIFAPVCVMTSLLAVSLGLSDFLADGLSIKKQGTGKLLLFAATFLPPLILVIFFPNMFLLALGYAGTFCLILLGLLPCLMVWQVRYKQPKPGMYQVIGGKWLIIGLGTLLTLFIIVSLLDDLHLL